MVRFVRIFACGLLILIFLIIKWPFPPGPPEPICIVCGGSPSVLGDVVLWLGLLTGVVGLILEFRGNAAR